MSIRTILVAIPFLLMISAHAMQHAFSAALPASVEAASGIVGWISIKPTGAEGQDQMLAIAGRALALRPVEGRYVLDVTRQGRSGSSTARQGGAITLKPGVTATLSQSAINIGPADRLEIELRIYVDDREVFAASMKSMGSGIKL
jgi:hypothetical protein